MHRKNVLAIERLEFMQKRLKPLKNARAKRITALVNGKKDKKQDKKDFS